MSVLDNIKFVPCNTGNGGTKYRDPEVIRYLVYHYTGNDGDTGANNAAYYAHTKVGASAHYFVDDGSITQSVRDCYIAWAVGGKKWSDCGETGGGKLYGACTNTNSISIELCDTRRDGTLNVTEATLANAVALGRMLMAKYDIPIENVVRHFDVTGKHCPAYFMDNTKWQAFKARLAPEPTTCAVTLPVLKRGEKCVTVRALQALLNLRGFRLEVDGSYGPLTEQAVRTWQKRAQITVTGKADASTWASLLEADGADSL